MKLEGFLPNPSDRRLWASPPSEASVNRVQRVNAPQYLGFLSGGGGIKAPVIVGYTKGKVAPKPAPTPAPVVDMLQQDKDNLKQIVSAGIPLTSAQLNSVVDAIAQLPQDRIAQIYNAQVSMSATAPAAGLALHGLGSFFTKIRNAVESVAVAPVTLIAPHGIVAGTVSKGAQANAITFTRLRDATETVASIASNYYVPGLSAVLSKYVVSKGSQAQLSSNVGKIAQVATSVAGAYNLISTSLAKGALAATPATSPILQTVPAGYAEAGYTGASTVAPASYGAIASSASTAEAAGYAAAAASPSVTASAQLISSLTQKAEQVAVTEAGKLATDALLPSAVPSGVSSNPPAAKPAATGAGLLAFVPLLLLLK
jgi:hypothetical protein